MARANTLGVPAEALGQTGLTGHDLVVLAGMLLIAAIAVAGLAWLGWLGRSRTKGSGS